MNVFHGDYADGRGYVSCDSCYADGPLAILDPEEYSNDWIDDCLASEAIKLWNSRTTPLTKTLEELPAAEPPPGTRD